MMIRQSCTSPELAVVGQVLTGRVQAVGRKRHASASADDTLSTGKSILLALHVALDQLQSEDLRPYWMS